MVARRPPKQLTTGSGIEWSPVMTKDGSNIVYFHADAHQPGQPVLLKGQRTQMLALESLPAEFPNLFSKNAEVQQDKLRIARGLGLITPSSAMCRSQRRS
jgi:Tol biopolymer transport system component